jgi:hypothetical protein
MGPEPFISDKEAEKALDYLRDSAVKLGDAKYQVVMTEKMAKRKFAISMSLSQEKTIAAQEREALASDIMKEAWEEEAEAAKAYEVLRAYRDAAIAKIEAWRSLTASYRAMSK